MVVFQYFLKIDFCLPVQLEGVRSVTMSCIFIQVLGQIDNLNGLKWAFLHSQSIAIINLNFINYMPPIKLRKLRQTTRHESADLDTNTTSNT